MSNGTSVFIERLNDTKKSLLDQIEDSGHDVYNQCRDGFCGCCATKIVSGEVEYFKNVIAVIKEDQILPCSCRPKSNVVELSL
jgi:ferredoxin